MGERIIIDDEPPKPAPDVVVIKEEPKAEVKKTVTEKTVVVEKRDEAR
jgi:hypothetical protein